MNEDMKAVFEKLGTVTQEVNVNAVFGEPEQVGDYILIPVAELMYGIGAAAGTGPAGGPQEEEAEAPEPSDEQVEEESSSPVEGGGGAAGAKARPIAYIEVGPEGTHVKAIVDEQKVALAGIFLSIWAVGWVAVVLKAIFGRRR